MTTSASFRGPFANKVPILALNVGDEDLPAFSVAEITDSFRPDAWSTLAYGGGQTALKVQVATADSPSLSCTVGPMRIRQNKTGPVFLTVESFARYSGTVAVGDAVGVASGSTDLVVGQSGYFVVGDIDSATSVCRVMRVGGAGNHDFGVLTAALGHKKVGTVELLQVTGEYEVGDTVTGPSSRAPQQFMTVINLTGLELKAGTVAEGPYMIVEKPNQFSLPRVFPDQIEECYAPLFTPNNDGV